MFRPTVVYIKIHDGQQAEFEAAAAEQVRRVKENEPGTVLYTFWRRAQPNEYFHLYCYADEAAFNRHIELEAGWWGPTLQSFLARPNERERFEPGDIVTGITRDYSWPAG